MMATIGKSQDAFLMTSTCDDEQHGQTKNGTDSKDASAPRTWGKDNGPIGQAPVEIFESPLPDDLDSVAGSPEDNPEGLSEVGDGSGSHAGASDLVPSSKQTSPQPRQLCAIAAPLVPSVPSRF